MKRIFSITALGFSLMAISSAFAADGYVTSDVNLRAGPDSSYPSVAILPAGMPVAIQGCVDGWSWCDVATAEDRGWVAGNFLQEEYQGQRVLIPDYGLQIGIPVVSFAFGAYWDDHYRNRSWYGNRERWSHVQPQYQSYSVRDGSHRNSRDTIRGNSHSVTRDDSRRSTVGATSDSYHGGPTNKPAPQHPVATDFRSQDRISGHERPVQRNAAESRATVQPSAIATQRVVGASPQHKEAPARSAPQRENGKDSERGKDKDKDQQH